MLKKIIYLLFPVLFLVKFCAAQPKQEKAVTAAVEALKKAMIDGDKAMLDKYASDKLSYGHSGGKIEGKESFVQSLTNGTSDFVTINLTEQTISISKKTALVRHKLSATTNDGGKAGTVNLFVLLVWQKLHGQWQLLARQAVKIM